MTGRSPMDDPETAAHAWARYRRLMGFMSCVTIGVVTLAIAVTYYKYGMASVHLFIAIAVGVGLTMMLMSALMGLVFLSSGTGHDEAVLDPLSDDSQPEDGRRR